jgi:predicted metal-binding membrane protein
MTMNALDNFLRHDRIVVLSSLAGVIAIAWVYLLLGAGIEMDEMDMGGGQIMLMAPPWTPRYAVLIFLMWSIMMMAMMLPSAAPTILLVSALARNRGIGHGAQAAGLFTLGYVMTWVGFSLVAALLQWGLDSAGVLSDAMAAKSAAVAGSVLIAAGVYQWTPLKQACLRHCRSPLAFLLHHWRKGAWGAVTNGMHHRFFCLGCCWMLMVLLFIGGLMNLLWIGALALLVLIEKTLPWGGRTSRVTGAALVAWGAVMLVRTYWSGLPSSG